MCTALNFSCAEPFFGRTLDLEGSLGEEFVFMPRGFSYPWLQSEARPSKYAVLGIGIPGRERPLFYDAVNQQGLCAAGLHFPRSAACLEPSPGFDNLAAYELIPWVLSRCGSVEEAWDTLECVRIVDIPTDIPVAPLHWLIGDGQRSFVAEPMAEGLKLYENPLGVLTNEPPFPQQLQHLTHFPNLSPEYPKSHFLSEFVPEVYGEGLGALGLPGDASPMSRFVRLAFHARFSQGGGVSQMMGLLESVAVPRGSCRTESGKPEFTVYTAVIQPKTGNYFLRTYENHRILEMKMGQFSSNCPEIQHVPIPRSQDIAHFDGQRWR